MIKVGELRHGSCYIFNEKIIRYHYGFKGDLSYWDGYLLNLDPIPFTDDVFNLVRVELRPIFDQSAELNLSVRMYRFPEDRYYTFASDDVCVKPIYNYHELQNLVFELYDVELYSIDERTRIPVL